MLDKLATFSEKLEKKGLFDILDQIEKSVKTAAAAVNYPGFKFIGYDKNTKGPWYQGQGKYWYQPPGSKQWIPYINLPGQDGGQKSLTEDPYTKLEIDPTTGYLTSPEIQADRAKYKQEAAQIAAGGVGIIGAGSAAGTHLGGQLAKNWEIFNNSYNEIKKLEGILKETSNVVDRTRLEKQIQQLGNQVIKAYNNYQKLSKFHPNLDSRRYKKMQMAAKYIAKNFKTKGVEVASKDSKVLGRAGQAVRGLGNLVKKIDLTKGVEVASKDSKVLGRAGQAVRGLGNLVKNARFMQYFRSLPPGVQARVPQILQMIRSGASAAQIAATTAVGSTIIIALALYAGWHLSGGAEALRAVQEANKNIGLARMQGQGQYTSGNQIRKILQKITQMPQQNIPGFINSNKGALQNYARFISQTDLTPQEKQQFITILNQYGIQVPTGQNPGALGGGFWSTVYKSL